MNIKPGDIITARYKWEDEWIPVIGYVYKVGDDLFVGLSFSNGGCTNYSLSSLRSIQKVKT